MSKAMTLPESFSRNYKNMVRNATNPTSEADLKTVPLGFFSSFFSVASFKKFCMTLDNGV